MMVNPTHMLATTICKANFMAAIMEKESIDMEVMVDMDLVNMEMDILRDGAHQKASLIVMLDRNVIV